MNLPATDTPEGVFEYLLAFVFVSLLVLSVLYVVTGVVPL
jgi:hypothetical protein